MNRRKSGILERVSKVVMLLAVLPPPSLAGRISPVSSKSEPIVREGEVDRTVDHVLEPWAPARWVVFVLDPAMTQIVRGTGDVRTDADLDELWFDAPGLEFSTQIRRRIDSLDLSPDEATHLWKRGTEELIGIAAETVRALHGTNDVGVLLVVPPDQPELGALTSERALEGVIEGLRNFPGGDVLLESPQVEFVQLRVDSCWIRDYGPIVGVTRSGRIVFVDAQYSNRPVGSSTFGLNFDARWLDDQIPQAIALLFRQLVGSRLAAQTVSVIKSPLVIQVGDFATAGDVGFASVNMLALNGMDADELTAKLRELLGVGEMVYLEPLPGMTVKHIDMICQVAAENVLLLGTFGQALREGPVASLVQEAAGRLEYNLRILCDFYEGRGRTVRVHRDGDVVLDPCAMNIVLVPMPEPSRPALEDFERVKAELERARAAVEAAQEAVDELRDGQVTCEEILNELFDLEVELAGVLASIEPGTTLSESARTSLDSGPGRLAELRSMLDPWLQRLSGRGSESLDVFAPLADGESVRLDESVARTQAIRLQAATEVLSVTTERVQQLLELERDAATERAQYVRERRDALEIERYYADPDGFNLAVETQTDVIRTYLNYLFVRTAVDRGLLLVPSYDGHDATERQALPRIASVYAQLYGDVDLRAIKADALIQAMGAIHCVTWTSPRGIELRIERFGVLKRHVSTELPRDIELRMERFGVLERREPFDSALIKRVWGEFFDAEPVRLGSVP